MNLEELGSEKYAVIDLDSGTVLGLSLRLVPVPEDEDFLEEILENGTSAVMYAKTHGTAFQVTGES